MKQRYIFATLMMLATVIQTAAQTLKDRYNKDHPVTIVCENKNPPYEFLSDKATPTGFNIDVIKAVMMELDLPCSFKMQSKEITEYIINAGDADLILSGDFSLKKKGYYMSEDVISYNQISSDLIIETHFWSKDRQLIDQMDDQYARLKQRGEIANIKDRWLHPERLNTEATPLAMLTIITIVVIAVIFYMMSLVANMHAKRIHRKSNELTRMMYKALHMGSYDILKFDIAHNRFYNQYGNILPEKGMSFEEFIKRTDSGQRAEFAQKMHMMKDGQIKHFELDKRWNKGTEDAPEYLTLQGHAILELDKKERPAYIINAVNDVTKDAEIKQSANDLKNKYNVLLDNPYVAMAFYDVKGNIIDQNSLMMKLGNTTEAVKHMQPLYDARGEIASYFVITEAS